MREAVRTCLGCRQRRAKKELIRFVMGSDQGVMVDPTGKVPGRGAYVCAVAECVKAGVNAKKLQRALRSAVADPTITSLKTQLLTMLKEKREGVSKEESHR